jgi:RNA polymerase sigma factor (sigma-70 family)
MHELVQLARACRSTDALHVRVRFAEEIVVRVGPMLAGFIRRRVPESVVEDVLQETLIAIASDVVKFKGGTDAAFWGWCYKIAWHKAADRLRREGARPAASLELPEIRRAAEALAAESPLSTEERQYLDAALELLQQSKPPCVDYLTDRFILGLAFAELAAIYGSTPDAMRMHVDRCLELARKLVEADHPSHD